MITHYGISYKAYIFTNTISTLLSKLKREINETMTIDLNSFWLSNELQRCIDIKSVGNMSERSSAKNWIQRLDRNQPFSVGIDVVSWPLLSH